MSFHWKLIEREGLKNIDMICTSWRWSEGMVVSTCHKLPNTFTDCFIRISGHSIRVFALKGIYARCIMPIWVFQKIFMKKNILLYDGSLMLVLWMDNCNDHSYVSWYFCYSFSGMNKADANIFFENTDTSHNRATNSVTMTQQHFN